MESPWWLGSELMSFDVTVVFVVLITLPSLVLWTTAGGRVSAVEASALAGTVLFGVFSFVALLSLWFPIPFGPGAVWIVYGVVLGFAVILGRAFLKRSAARAAIPGGRSPGNLLLLAVSVVVNARIWATGDMGRSVIPNHDAQFHAAFVSNIVRFGSLQTPDAYSNFLTGRGPRNIYPLAYHGLSAFVQMITDALPSQVIFSTTAVTVVLAWPVVIYAWLRILSPEAMLAPGIATLLLTALFQFPIGTMGWGGVPMVVGIVLLVASAIAVESALRRGVLWGTALFAICSLVLVMVHTSEVFLLPAFVLATSWRTLRDLAGGEWARRGLVLSSLIALAYPYIERALGSSMISGLASVDPNQPGPLYVGVGLSVMLNAGASVVSIWPVVFLVVAVIGLRYSTARVEVHLLYLFCLAMTLVASQALQPGWRNISLVTAPWYRQFQRMTYFLVPLLAVMTALAVEGLWNTSRAWTRDRGRILLTGLLHTAWVGLAVMLVVLGHRATVGQQKAVFGSFSPFGREVQLAPSRVASISNIKGTILASFDSGAGYWEMDHGVPVLASPFLDSGRVVLRELLNDAIVDRAERPDVQSAIDFLDVTHVITNDRSMSGAPRPAGSDVALSGNFSREWTADGFTLWRLNTISTAVTKDHTIWYRTVTDEPVRWITSTSTAIRVQNDDTKTRSITVKIPLHQTPCQSASRVTLNDQRFVAAVRAIPMTATVIVPKGESRALPLTIEGTSCVVEGVAGSAWAGLGPIEVGEG